MKEVPLLNYQLYLSWVSVQGMFMEHVLKSIIEGISNNYGKAFFETIALKLHEAVEADFTFITRIDDKDHMSRTIVLVEAGKVIGNIEYGLKDTPCAEVSSDNMCLYPRDICKYFPYDQLLVDMGIEGYVGTPLNDSNGRLIGLAVALYKEPIKDIDFVQMVFQLFSGRIAAEIERSEYEENLEAIVTQRTAHLEDAMHSLKRTQTQLIQQEKLASLGGVVAGVAHEINTPLGIAKTGHSFHIDLLKKVKKDFYEKTLTASAMQDYIDQALEIMATVEGNLERAIDLVKNFKHAAVDRIDSEIHLHNLHDVISRVIVSLAAEFQRNQITCTADINEALEINTFGSDLTQVVSNLIMNASVHAFDGKENKQIFIQAKPSGNNIELLVSDNGVGVNESIRHCVFDPFVTTKRHSGSTGLGMNIVYNLVTSKLKGSIELVLPEEGGTQWKMIFPKSVEDKAPAITT